MQITLSYKQITLSLMQITLSPVLTTLLLVLITLSLILITLSLMLITLLHMQVTLSHHCRSSNAPARIVAHTHTLPPPPLDHQVQYPNALPTMSMDLKNLRACAYFLSKTECVGRV